MEAAGIEPASVDHRHQRPYVCILRLWLKLLLTLPADGPRRRSTFLKFREAVKDKVRFAEPEVCRNLKPTGAALNHGGL